jgi:H+/gluconate symporter-like permease
MGGRGISARTEYFFGRLLVLGFFCGILKALFFVFLFARKFFSSRFSFARFSVSPFSLWSLDNSKSHVFKHYPGKEHYMESLSCERKFFTF